MKLFAAIAVLASVFADEVNFYIYMNPVILYQDSK